MLLLFHKLAPKLIFRDMMEALATALVSPILGLRMRAANSVSFLPKPCSSSEKAPLNSDRKLFENRETISSASQPSGCGIGVATSNQVSIFAPPAFTRLLQCTLTPISSASSFLNSPREQVDKIRVQRGSLHVPRALPILFSTRWVPKASRRT